MPGRGKRGIGQRDRKGTRRKILAALGRLLARKGSSGLGINAISREAKVDKVLIYRYFGGIDQLYQAFALEGNTFPSLEEVAEGRLNEFPNLSPAEKAKVIVLGFGRAIRRRPITKELMRWELQERNALSDALAKERERQAQHWLGLAPDLHGADLPAVTALLVAGQVFLTRTVALVGIEGTGSYGAGLARHLAGAGVRVVVVDRSDRQDRHRQGKSDPLLRREVARSEWLC